MSSEDRKDNKQKINKSVGFMDENTPLLLEGGKHGKVRRVNPLGLRVLVRIEKGSDMTDGGLYLPEGAKDAMHESVIARVLEVASAVDQDTHEEANVSGIPHGSLVLIPKNAGIKVPWSTDLRIVETKEVLAIVNEISLV